MNPVMSFVAIVSLLLGLAAAGNTAKEQAQVTPPAAGQITPSKIALNHNETMVSDAALVQPADTWSQWLTSLRAFFVTSFSTSAPRPKGGCEDVFGCGMNHNETMVTDAALVQPADAWSQWLTSIQTFFVTSSSTSAPHPKGGCEDDFGCGTNHNETMVRDAVSVQPADAWSQWLTSLQAFFVTSFSTSAPRPKGGCEDDFGCGLNHNETMVRDAALVQSPDAWSQWLTSIRTFFVKSFSTSAPRPKGGCDDDFGCGMNHNETMVSDTTLVQQTEHWSKWLTTIQTFFVTSFSTSAPRPKGGCDDDFGCGTNHNETMVSDTPLVQQTDHWSKWLTTIQTFFVTSFSTGARGPKRACEDADFCGTNHNETMVSDAALVQPADTWSLWLTSMQTFLFTNFSTNTRSPKSGCEDVFGCGTNHNETMVREPSR